jgi:hypothetical protein
MKTTAQALLSRYWISIFLLVYGGFTALPFLAPVLIHAGWQQPAKLIYLIYSFVCHQLPERSFFLFGPRFSYSWQKSRPTTGYLRPAYFTPVHWQSGAA